MFKIFLLSLIFSITSNFLFAQIPSGFIAEYLLDENVALDQSGNNYNGTLTNTNNTTNRFGTANGAIALTAGSSTGTLPASLVAAVQNNFSIGFWFRTTMVAPNAGAWFSGRAMLDAEMCGGTTDWGIALIDGGGVCVGIGVTDVTIKSPLKNYNNGSWHFVTVTRNAAAGTTKLYMAGVQVAVSNFTTTLPLTAPTSIKLGANPCQPNGVFTGSLDDIIMYNRVLTDIEVSNLYTKMSAFALSLDWLSFSGHLQNNLVNLQWEVEAVVNNDRFEIEQSYNGIHFTKLGTVLNNAGVAVGGKYTYNFTANNNSISAATYYRIKQIDVDGKFTYSKTIKLVAANNTYKKLYLRTNPVVNEMVLINDAQTRVQQLEIIDASGRKVYHQAINTTEAIIRQSVQHLKAGYYSLKLYTPKGVTVLPLIKQ